MQSYIDDTNNKHFVGYKESSNKIFVICLTMSRPGTGKEICIETIAYD